MTLLLVAGEERQPDLRKLVSDIVFQEEHYRQVLTPVWRSVTEWWKLYLADRGPDTRKPHEKWRARVHLPYPYSVVETGTAATADLMDSADPQVQPDPVFEQDERRGRPITRLIDYTLRANRWPTKRELLLRDMHIQGTAFAKVLWTDRWREMDRTVSSAEMQRFVEKQAEAEKVTGAPAPLNMGLQAFEEWRRAVNNTYPGIGVPPLPIEGRRRVMQYSGPEIVRTSLWDLRFDPMIDEMDQQHLVIHRIVKPLAWVQAMANPANPDRIFDHEAVERARNNGYDERFTQWQRQQAESMGLAISEHSDPQYVRPVELWECWMPGTATPYAVVMNRSEVINLDPTQTPNESGRVPFYPLRNVAVGGQLLGISSLQQSKELFYEADALRGLRLDAVTLAVLPIFLRLKAAGLPEIARFFRPGSIIDVERPDGIQQLVKYETGIASAFQEISQIKGDVDETEATFAQIRGASSTVGRVSATESERRISQALQRTKMKVLRIEDEASAMIEECLMLWYQHSDPAVRIAASGGDPLIEVDRESLVAALEMNFRFRGAAKALNRELAGQQLMSFWSAFGSLLDPKGAVALARRVYETLGQKGADEVLGNALPFIEARMGGGGQQQGQGQPQQGQQEAPPPEAGGQEQAQQAPPQGAA